MKYVSIDIETTGLNPNFNQVIQVSFVIEDTCNIRPLTQLPHFTCYIDHEDRYNCGAFAAALNHDIFKVLSGQKKCFNNYPILTLEQFTIDASNFLLNNLGPGKYTAAGKNVAAFDLPFLPTTIQALFDHKTLDPGILYTKFLEDDTVPGLKKCKQRANLPGTVAHTAHEDALDVIDLLRRKYK